MKDISMNYIEAIKTRHSVRTYLRKAISQPHFNGIEAELKRLSADYGTGLTLLKNSFNGKQFGTYGIIKNADAYIVCVCQNERSALLKAGSALERAVLHCTALGIGTCWLGGTFSREEFSSAISVADGEVIPAVISVGYPGDKEGLIGGLLRMGAKSKTRMPFETLFFDRDFSQPLSPGDATAHALELVRIGPSASNKQPWRVLKDNNGLHFFIEHTPAYATKYDFDMQLLDLGIAMSHLELAMRTNGSGGKWQLRDNNFAALPPNTEYIESWVFE